MMKSKLKFERQIPQKTIQRTWHQQYPHERQPRIKMYILNSSEMNRTVNRERKRLGDTSKKEYKKNIATRNVQGMVMNTNQGYIILHRKDGSSLRTMKHEMKHIHNKEV